MLRLPTENTSDKKGEIMEEWKNYTLEEVCERIYSGGTPSTKHEEYWNGDIKWLSSGETSQRFVYDTERKITQEGVENSSTKLATKGCTVVATAGQGYTRGQASFLMTDTYMNQSVIACKANENVILPLYLYYNLDSRYEEFRLLSDGTSTRGGLSGWILKRMEIKLPPKSSQKKIIGILYSIDKKIEENKAINNNLEQQAQAIYQQMFIDNASSDWTEGTLSDIADITMGQSPSGSSYNEDGNGTIFFQGRAEFGFRFPTVRLYTTEPKRMACANDTLMSVRAPVGDLNVAHTDCCIGRGLAAIHSKNNHQSFVLYTMFSLKKQLDVFNGEGTVFGSINRNSLNKMPLLIPSSENIDEFEALVAPLDAAIRNNYDEVCRLEQLRDSLLPKLMSGELDVSDIEI